MFGHMVINPRRLPLRAEDAEGRTILTYEGDETRGGSKGRLHRAYVKFGKGGVRTVCCLERQNSLINLAGDQRDCSRTQFRYLHRDGTTSFFDSLQIVTNYERTTTMPHTSCSLQAS